MYGQSNVGHIVRDEAVSLQYLKYWNNLAQDLPGRRARHGDDKEAMDELNEQQQPDLDNGMCFKLLPFLLPLKRRANSLTH